MAAVYGQAPERVVSLREAIFAPCLRMPLQESVGQVAAEPMGVYPPGIALVMPGERLDREIVAFLLEEQADGAALFGVRDGLAAVIGENHG